MKVFLLVTIALLLGMNITKEPTVGSIRNEVKNSVVKITGVTSSGRKSGGTGFVFLSDKFNKYIVTNKHICELRDDNNTLGVKYPQHFRVYRQRVIEISEEHDLCLVEALNDFNTGLELADRVSIGEDVFAVGHPKLYALTISKGQYIEEAKIYVMMSKTEKRKVVEDITTVNFVQMSKLRPFTSSRFVMYSRGGNSGSAIVNKDGEVISVLFAGNRGDVMETYGVPLRYIKSFLEGY